MRINPRSYLLLAVHSSNMVLQGRLFFIRTAWERENPEKAEEQRKLAAARQADKQ